MAHLDQDAAAAPAWCSVAYGVSCRDAQMVTAAMQMSSIHIAFNTEAEWKAAKEIGWMSKVDLQFHWDNNGYKTFDDFLAALKQSKRKSIRQERKSIAKQRLRVERLTGDAITAEIWDKFFEFYSDTTGPAPTPLRSEPLGLVHPWEHHKSLCFDPW